MFRLLIDMRTFSKKSSKGAAKKGSAKAAKKAAYKGATKKAAAKKFSDKKYGVKKYSAAKKRSAKKGTSVPRFHTPEVVKNHARKIVQGLNEAEKIHRGEKGGISFDDFLAGF